MKAGTHNMMKFKRLQRCLGIPLWQAVGLLESLWQLTAKDTPRGDIGRFSDEDIAAWLEYADDAGELIQAFIDSGWIDRSDEYRLIIHDWHDHAAQYVKGNVAKYTGGFVTFRSEVPNEPRDEPPNEPPKERPLMKLPPSLAKPSQAKPSILSGSEEPDVASNGSRYSSDFEQFWQAFPKLRRTSKGKAWNAWTVAIGRTSPQWLINRAGEYAKSDKGRGEFCQMPSSWLTGCCWEDDAATWAEPGQAAPIAPAKRDPELVRNMLRKQIQTEAAERGLGWDSERIDQAVEKQFALTEAAT